MSHFHKGFALTLSSVLSNDGICFEILSFLSFFDLLKVPLVDRVITKNPKLQTIITRVCEVKGIENFKKFCHRYGIDYGSLIASMGNTGAVISGSFALQC